MIVREHRLTEMVDQVTHCYSAAHQSQLGFEGSSSATETSLERGSCLQTAGHRLTVTMGLFLHKAVIYNLRSVAPCPKSPEW